MYIILSQRIDKNSSYDDVPFSLYHFPKRYRKQIRSGDIFIYYQGDRLKKENRYYFGTGVIGAINLSGDKEHYYAHIMEGVSFNHKVPIYQPKGGFYESIDFNSVRNNEMPPWRSSVRPISNQAYRAIVQASGRDSVDLESASAIEKEKNPITVLQLLNERYEGYTPQKREMILNAHIDRGESVTISLKKILGAICQICGKEGFERSNGERYIEAHHLTQLALSTPQSLCSDNVILVCPNCHRQIHYGKEIAIENRGENICIKLDSSKRCIIHKNTIEYLQSLL